MFEKRKSVEQVEEQQELAPKFDAQGLIPCVTTEYGTGQVLMLGYMNQEALEKTIQNQEAYYYSRSRETLWHKGKTSGFIQKVRDIRIDDDQDAIWIEVQLQGPQKASCHVGYKSCFYRSIKWNSETKKAQLQFKEDKKTFDPKQVYGDVPNPTKL